MRNPVTAVLMGVMLVVVVGNVSAQIAGSTTPGMSVEELQTIARGWSATKQILGKPVYNAKNEKVGDVDDLIIAPDSASLVCHHWCGGISGPGRTPVAVPANHLKHAEGRIVLPDATKEAQKRHAVIPIR